LSVIVTTVVNEAMATVVAFSVASALLFWTSYKFNESENIFIGMLSQIFHGFAMILILGLLYFAYEYGGAGVENVTAAILAIFGLILFVYAMFLIVRNVFGILKAVYEMGVSYMKGDSERDNLSVRGGVGVEDTRR